MVLRRGRRNGTTSVMGREKNKGEPNLGVAAAIDVAGSMRALASLCGVTGAAVLKWLYGRPTAERAKQIEQKTGVPRKMMRPDLFGDLQ